MMLDRSRQARRLSSLAASFPGETSFTHAHATLAGREQSFPGETFEA